jgi:hypothetical protein
MFKVKRDHAAAVLFSALIAYFGAGPLYSQVVNPGVQYVGSPPANNDCIKASVVGGNLAGVTTTGGPCTPATTPAAATSANDTNVTLTLSGTPTTALLQAVQWQMGWTGTLAAGRLNANVVQGVTNDTNVTGSIATQSLTLGWTGTLAAGRLNANVVQAVTNDTNVTGSIATQSLTLGWSGVLSVARGGIGIGALGSDLSNTTNFHIGAFTGDVTKSAGALATTVNAVQGLAYKSGATYSNGQVPAWVATNSDFEPSSAGTGTVTNVVCGTGLSGGTITVTGTCAVSLTSITNSLASNVALNNSTYTAGPTVAQGTTGTWFASGTVTLNSSNTNDVFFCKLWDGTTVIDSISVRLALTTIATSSFSLSGVIATPAGNINISCIDGSSASGGQFVSNSSGNAKDSTITAFRIQ